MKNVLIYFPPSQLKPVGGPAGYLNNLYSGLMGGNEKIRIDFYDNVPLNIRDTVKHKNLIPMRIRELRRAINDVFYYRKKYDIDRELLKYDAIHFHNVDDLYLNRYTLEHYKGVVILTSHSPCAMFKEKLEWLNPFDYKLFRDKVERIEEIDKYAFTRADVIVFPCREAEEPYFNTWPAYSELRDANKYRYVATGIHKCTAKVNKDEFRERYNIPKDAFVISYAGRHNSIKGYGDLCEIGRELLVDKNVYFLVAGKEEPLTGVKSERWIEVGWTKDPHSLIAASDVFVLPNRETYFDLILLETLSLGIPIVMSNTGGNKYFKKYNLNGLRHYSEKSEAIQEIKHIQAWSECEKNNAHNELIALYENEFTVSSFAQNYLRMIESVLEDYKHNK